MASAPIVCTTTKFKSTAPHINSIPLSKFPPLLHRILSSLHLRSQTIFTPSETTTLANKFKFPNAGVFEDVVGCLCYVFEGAGYATVKPKIVKACLMEGGVDEEHAESFASTWGQHAGDVIARLKECTLGGPKILSDVSWNLHVNVAQSGLTRTQNAIARFELQLEKPDKKLGSNEGDEVIGVEFGHEELYDFFCKLETIQAQLDAIS